MRFNDFGTFDTVTQVVGYIKKNCQPWLQQTDNGKMYVYRGTKNPPDELGFVKNIRTDRHPKDTEPDRHDIFNRMLAIAGSKANRSNSMFVTSAPTMASDFGTVFVVLPIGEFNYTWSPRWIDWTRDIHLEDMKDFVKPGLLKMRNPYSWYIKTALADPTNFNVDEVDEAICVDEFLPQAIRKHHEIMIHAKGAVYVNPTIYQNKVLELL